jgi:hypothetical protein
MTVGETREALFQWFESNESFALERDYSKLVLITDTTDEEKKAGIKAALTDFVELSFVKESEYEGVTYHFLIQPFHSMEQNITLNSQTALSVSKSINNFCELINDHRDWCDCKNVSEKDILNLTSIIQMMYDKNEDLS